MGFGPWNDADSAKSTPWVEVNKYKDRIPHVLLYWPRHKLCQKWQARIERDRERVCVCECDNERARAKAKCDCFGYTGIVKCHMAGQKGPK